MNLLRDEIRLADGKVLIEVAGQPLLAVAGPTAERLMAHANAAGTSVQVGTRPQHVELAAAGGGGLRGSVRTREFLGERVFFTVEAGRRRIRAVGPCQALPCAEGEGVLLRIQPERAHFFRTTTGDASGKRSRS